MTKKNIITNSLIIYTLKNYFTIQIAIGITKESQKLSLYSTKIYIKHTKDFRFLISALNSFVFLIFMLFILNIIANVNLLSPMW